MFIYSFEYLKYMISKICQNHNKYSFVKHYYRLINSYRLIGKLKIYYLFILFIIIFFFDFVCEGVKLFQISVPPLGFGVALDISLVLF